MQEIIIIGGGGHARVLIDLIKTSGQYKITGILDSQLEKGSTVAGITVIGNEEMLLELYDHGIRNACIGIGSVKDNSKRKMLYEKVIQFGFFAPFLIHRSSIASENIDIAGGVQIMAGAIVQTGSSIGENTIVNTGAIVEHDCAVGSHVHICPGTVISGGCTVGEGAFVGAGATVLQGIKIGNNSIVSAGAVVINDVSDNAKVIGVPAR